MKMRKYRMIISAINAGGIYLILNYGSTYRWWILIIFVIIQFIILYFFVREKN
jgi:hypothetical protein